MKMFKTRLQKSLALLLILLVALSAWGVAENFANVDLTEWEPLARGAKGEVVVQLQEQLIELGFLDGKADGSFGPKTEAALIAFQAAAELEETGVADAETMEALFDPEAPIITPAPKPTVAPTPQPQKSSEMVWIPRTGQRYHRNQNCSGMKNPSYVTIEEAKRLGFTPCKKCYK